MSSNALDQLGSEARHRPLTEADHRTGPRRRARRVQLSRLSEAERRRRDEQHLRLVALTVWRIM